MPELNPCTRCNGSGTKPDPLTDAAQDLDSTLKIIISDPQVRDVLHVKALALSAAAALCLMDRDARITSLEAALGGILSQVEPHIACDKDHLEVRFTGAAVASFRQVLEGAP